MITSESLQALSFQGGQRYEVGVTPTGSLVLVGRESGMLQAITSEGDGPPLPLESFIKFQVPITWHDEPRLI